MIMYCIICDKQVGLDPGCSKMFRHTWTRINGVCRYVTICDECWKGREWCMPTKKEEVIQEKKDGIYGNRKKRGRKKK